MVKDNILTENQTPAVNRDDVLDVEELAYSTGITGDQAQDLTDRIGTDRVALEQAARQLKGQ